MSIDFESLFNLPRDQATPEPRPRRWGWLVALVLLTLFLVVGAREIATVTTDGWWFASLGQTPVFRTQLFTPFALFAALFILGALWLAANWLVAARRVAGAAAWPGQRIPAVATVGMRRLALLAALVAAAFVAAGAAADWPELLLYLHRSPFGGMPDPVFGRDVGFYVFELPILALVQSLASAWVLVALIGTVAIYALGGAVNVGHVVSRRAAGGTGVGAGGTGEAGNAGSGEGRGGTGFGGPPNFGRRRRPSGVGRASWPSWSEVRLPGAVRAHLALLAALFALVLAWGVWLSRFELLYTEHVSDVYFGPGYADVHARLPAYTLVAGLWVAVAVLCLIATRWGRWWLPLGAALVVLGIEILGGEAYPALVQAYRVRPDELRLETPYIASNIAMTLAAYDLETVAQLDYTPVDRVSPAHLATHRATIDAVRLWDWPVLLDFLNQKQSIRPYYAFRDVDIDRYATGDGHRQVELAGREIHPAGLSNPRWVNRVLEYTHGFGAALAPVNAIAAGGQPELWVRDIPPVSDPAFGHEISQPRLYFGESSDGEYVIVGTRTDEFDYPSGSGNARNRYNGSDGVVLSSWLRRLAFALRFGDSETLFSGALTPESRILLYRNIHARVRRLAPFLEFDEDPYLVIAGDGRLVWIQDAYTVTDHYPYSQPVSGAARIGAGSPRFLASNYIRNSVKVVIDAYDGTVDFYVADDTDPLIQAWAEVFPTLFQPAAAMPADLVAHWRYPETLFRAQAALYARYHMTEPDVFYNAEDLWAAPMQTRDQGETQPLEPYYVTMQLRGEREPEFVLMLPFVPAGKKNMIAWLAVRSDPAHYGELVLYNFGKGQQTDGPEQVESRIDNDTEISAQLTLWSQAGSQTIRGNLLVIPLGDALLYVEPLYLQAENNALPELKRVIVADGVGVEMRETLDEALAGLARGTAGEAEAASQPSPAPERAGDEAAPSPSAAETPGPASAVGSPGPPSARGTPGTPSDVAELVRSARTQETRAREALAAGDWERFGAAMAALQRTLDQLAALSGGPVSTPTAAIPDSGATPAPTLQENKP